VAAAGVPYRTADGVADFHALRHTYCTDLIATGTDIKTAHLLMRHKSLEMTMSYAKTDDARKAAAVDLLDRPEVPEVPELLRTCTVDVTPEDDTLRRLFGTDRVDDLELLGRVRVEGNGDVVLAEGPYAGEVLASLDDGCDVGFNQAAINPDAGDSEGPETTQTPDSPGFTSNAPCRTRTYNPLIKSQLLCQLS
jgi:hypothetical protein